MEDEEDKEEDKDEEGRPVRGRGGGSETHHVHLTLPCLSSLSTRPDLKDIHQIPELSYLFV